MDHPTYFLIMHLDSSAYVQVCTRLRKLFLENLYNEMFTVMHENTECTLKNRHDFDRGNGSSIDFSVSHLFLSDPCLDIP